MASTRVMYHCTSIAAHSDFEEFLQEIGWRRAAVGFGFGRDLLLLLPQHS